MCCNWFEADGIIAFYCLLCLDNLELLLEIQLLKGLKNRKILTEKLVTII